MRAKVRADVVAAAKSEIAEVGADEFCRRRIGGDVPDRLLLALMHEAAPDPSSFARTHGSMPRNLTGRRLQMLTLAAEGMENREIAGALGVAYSTVLATMQAVYVLFGARNRAHAVHLAHKRGML